MAFTVPLFDEFMKRAIPNFDCIDPSQLARSLKTNRDLDAQQGVVHSIASYFWWGLDMINVPLAQEKNHLSELIGRVERGETVAVTRRGKPVVQLVVYPTEGRTG